MRKTPRGKTEPGKRAAGRPGGSRRHGAAPEAPALRLSASLADLLDDSTRGGALRFAADPHGDLARLRLASPSLVRALERPPTLTAARRAVADRLDRFGRDLADGKPPLPVLERATAEDCLAALRSVFAPVNERSTGHSALATLRDLLRGRRRPDSAASGFYLEFIHLFQGVEGRAGIYRVSFAGSGHDPDVVEEEALRRERTDNLDALSHAMGKFFRKYPSGLEEEVRAWRRTNRRRILSLLGGTKADWNDPAWQLANVVRDAGAIGDIIELSAAERAAIERATSARIPFGVTPYYLSLMDRRRDVGFDTALRAQVIPPPETVEAMVVHDEDRLCAFDFMGERDTSPVPLVTRRYPAIAILKPFNTCAQICVYCQRNWQIDDVGSSAAAAPAEEVERAIRWIEKRSSITDVLVTGGDPLLLPDEGIEALLTRLFRIPHVARVRIGTRTPVALPMRITDRLALILARHRVPGRREVAVITHVEHPYEITPELVIAVETLRARGIPLYNQQVFTTWNSRRFETARLRRLLRLAGIDPYYTFNMKGKDEMRRYRVPVARILQERKEEARLMPGLDRTDEPVFNVPRLGKNHLRASQDRRLATILPDGSRVYEFHAWEKNLAVVPTYLFTDVPIHEYLERLAALGENPYDYRTIWYYY